jgi:GT2 family glycosyltransferase
MNSYGTPSLAIRAVKKVNQMKIGWVAPFDLDAAQTRIRVINIHRRLTSIGWDSKIINFENAINDFYDIVIVGKDFSQFAYDSIKTIKAKGSYIIADICEDLLDLNIPFYKDIIAISDKVVSASDYMATRLKIINPHTITIQDAIETDLALNCAYVDRPLKVVWFGYGGNQHLANKHRTLIESMGMQLVVISEWDDADIKWNRHTWVNEILNCDIAFIPQRIDQPSKSNNKCTQMMALGLPVVTTHHPAYESLIKDDCGYFFESDEELKTIFDLLKNKTMRWHIGTFGKTRCNEFTIPYITDQWINTFKEIQQKVDIIIATYNNLDYLKLTIESIKKCTTYPYEILVVDSGTDNSHEYCLKNDIPIIHSNERLTFSQANNIGIKSTKNHYICLLNNDVIVSYNWLQHLVAGTKHFDLVGPLSNCDKGWLHNYDIRVDDVDLIPAMKISDFKNIELLYSVNGMDQLFERQWVAFYCTLMRREIAENIGLLDEQYRNNSEDLDYSVRANLLGYKCGQNFNSFVFHFGGKTRKISENENNIQHHIENDESTLYHQKKYAKKTVVIWQGPSFVPWDHRSLESGGIGGSEVWTINLAIELDKLGYTVKVFNDCPNKRKYFGNIEYLHWTEFGDWNDMNYAHYFISSRSLEPFKLNLRAGEKHVMIHDMWVMLNSPEDIQLHTKVDKFFCLSTRHKEFFCDHHNINPERVLITSNGIDLTRFKTQEKDRYKVLYTSSPDRGLENLLNIWPKIKERVPKIHLHIYYGFDWIKDKQWVDMMFGLIKSLEDVHYHGKVNQFELADAFMTSSIFTAPNFFEETFFIGGLECMASGCVYLGSGYWGVLDTIKTAGCLIPIVNRMDCTTPDYHARFINEIESLIHNDNYFNRFQNLGYERVKRFTWENVALQWQDWFENKNWKTIQFD